MSHPQPVYSPEMLITDLRTAELLLIMTLRLFALSWSEPEGDHPNWREGLEMETLPSWTPLAFEALLRVVATSTRRPLDVRCPRCSSLGYDEGRLLQIVGLLQHRRSEAAAAVLESWLPPTACRLAVSPASGLAKGLQQGDLIIPLRPSTMRAVPIHHLHANSGLLLVQ